MGFIEEVGLLLEPTRAYIQSNAFVYAIVVFILAFLIAKGSSVLFHNLIHRFLRKHKIDTRVVVAIENPTIILIILSIFYMAIVRWPVPDHLLLQWTRTGILITTAFVLNRLITGILETWSHRMSNRKGAEFHEEVLPLTKGGLKVIIGVVTLIIVFEIWDIEVGPLLVSLGVGGAILGLSFQDSLKNMVGGIALIMDRSFRRGDVVKLESGELGEVIEVNLRSTKIKNYDNEITIIPNGLLANSRFTNLAQPTPTLRLMVPVNVVYGSDPDRVSEVLLSALKGHKEVLKYPKREVRFEQMADYSLAFKLIFYISNYKDMFQIRNQITSAVYKELYRAGIGIPFPTRTLYTPKEGPLQYNPPAVKDASSKK